MRILHIDTSIPSDGSVTREVSAAIVKRLADGSGAEVTYHDLVAENLPHLTVATLPTAHPAAASAGPLDGAARAAREASDRMLDAFIAADVVVIGAPMYNFTVPTQLKALVDRIVIPGKTFAYGPNGPRGLAGGKRVIVAIARGGFYGSESAYVSAEHAESYLRTAMGFMGVTALEFVLAEGLAVGEESRAKALASARDAVGQLAA